MKGSDIMKLQEGEKYDIEITLCNDEKPTKFLGAYFMWVGLIDEENPIKCDCCGKSVMKKFAVFRVPCEGATYDECSLFYFTDELIVGQTCLSKAKIQISLPYQKLMVIKQQI